MLRADPAWLTGASLEADPGRLLRRIRRAVTGRSVRQDLAEAVGGRRILVTGASSGLGRGTALSLCRAGATVLTVARRADELQQLAQEAVGPGECVPLPCDLSREAEVTALVESVLADGGVEVLVNNAGRSLRRTMTESAERLHDFERVMRLNYFGALWLTVPLVEHMRARSGGHVVNVSTMGTQFQGTPRFAAYMASKAALEQFAKSVAPETHRDRVCWTTVHMPLVETEMLAPAAEAWRSYPKLSLADGVSMIEDALIRRPARVTAPFGVAAELVDRLATRPMIAAKSRVLFPGQGALR